MLIVGAVALVVIGPKELPRALRTVGQMTGKLKRMAGEFQSQFSDAMREADLDEVRRQVESAKSSFDVNPMQSIGDQVREAIEGKPEVKKDEGEPQVDETAPTIADPVLPPMEPLPPVVIGSELQSAAAPEAEPVAEPKPKRPRKAKAAATSDDAQVPS